ncbi:MAG: hypothetical protein WAX04_13800 [Oscillospiraceae bacterium]
MLKLKCHWVIMNFAMLVERIGMDRNICLVQETVCMKADKIFNFYRNGSQIMGHNVKLIKQIDGNLHTSEINDTDF